MQSEGMNQPKSCKLSFERISKTNVFKTLHCVHPIKPFFLKLYILICFDIVIALFFQGRHYMEDTVWGPLRFSLPASPTFYEK